MSEEVTRTDEEKAQMYSAMLGSVSVITNALNSENDFCSDLTAQEVKDRVMRSCGYLEHGKSLSDWGSEDFSTVDSAIAAAKAYTP